MRSLVMILIFSLSSSLGMTQVAGLKDIIRDPSVSRRCKSLIEARNEKIRAHQRLNSLLQRSKKLDKRVRSTQITAKRKLEMTKTEIQNNIRLSSLRIKTMEEDIVRKGCPGISL